MAGERNTAQDTRGDSALLPPHLRGRPADTRSRPSEPRWGHEGATKGPRGATKGPPREESLSRRGHPARGAYRGATSGGHQPASRCKHTESIQSPLLVVLPTVVAH